MSQFSSGPVAIVMLALCSACSLPGTVVGNGDAVTEQRDVGGFSGVSADNLVRVEVSVGEPGPVVLTCDKNLLPYIESEVDDGVLHIRTANLRSLRSDLDCVALVTAPGFDLLRSSGSGGLVGESIFDGLGDVESTGSGRVAVGGAVAGAVFVRNTGSGGIQLDVASADVLDVDDTGSGAVRVDGISVGFVDARGSGSGGITLSGVTDTVELTSTGSGGIDGRDLEAFDAVVRVTGSGGIRVNASESIEVNITGSGGVEVFGDPAVHDESVSGSGGVVYR
jgi:hypothetical protein